MCGENGGRSYLKLSFHQYQSQGLDTLSVGTKWSLKQRSTIHTYVYVIGDES